MKQGDGAGVPYVVLRAGGAQVDQGGNAAMPSSTLAPSSHR
jgi:hypothetical protein